MNLGQLESFFWDPDEFKNNPIFVKQHDGTVKLAHASLCRVILEADRKTFRVAERLEEPKEEERLFQAIVFGSD